MKYPTEYKYNVLVERYFKGLNTREYSIGLTDSIQGVIDIIRKDTTGRVNAYGYRRYVVVDQENGKIKAISKRA
jgi:hypothetical protein